MQYEGDCRCGNAYGKYGTTECVNDCSSKATFFGKWVNCVYGISTNAETLIENDPSLAKDESEIERNTDNTNAISQEDSSANVDEPPSEVYFRQSLENVKNVNLNPEVQAGNSLEQLDSNIDVQPNPEQLESNTDVQPDLTSFLHPNGAPKIMKRKATFIGCYADEKDRDLPIQLLGSRFTHEQCYQGCSTQGYGE